MQSKICQWDFTMNKCVFTDLKVQQGILHLLGNALFLFFWIIHKNFGSTITDQVFEVFQI